MWSSILLSDTIKKGAPSYSKSGAALCSQFSMKGRYPYCATSEKLILLGSYPSILVAKPLGVLRRRVCVPTFDKGRTLPSAEGGKHQRCFLIPPLGDSSLFL